MTKLFFQILCIAESRQSVRTDQHWSLKFIFNILKLISSYIRYSFHPFPFKIDIKLMTKYLFNFHSPSTNVYKYKYVKQYSREILNHQRVLYYLSTDTKENCYSLISDLSCFAVI